MITTTPQLTFDDIMRRLGVSFAEMFGGKDEMTKAASADEWIIVDVPVATPEKVRHALPYWIRWLRPGVQDWTDDPTDAHGYASAAAAWRMIESAPLVFAGCEPRLRSEVMRG